VYVTEILSKLSCCFAPPLRLKRVRRWRENCPPPSLSGVRPWIVPIRCGPALPRASRRIRPPGAILRVFLAIRTGYNWSEAPSSRIRCLILSFAKNPSRPPEAWKSTSGATRARARSSAPSATWPSGPLGTVGTTSCPIWGGQLAGCRTSRRKTYTRCEWPLRCLA